MSFNALCRCTGLLLITLMSGCTVTGPEVPTARSLSQPGIGGTASNPYADTGREDDCVSEPSKCRYEPGEREFAENEAARLNREAARKLRGNSVL